MYWSAATIFSPSAVIAVVAKGDLWSVPARSQDRSASTACQTLQAMPGSSLQPARALDSEGDEYRDQHYGVAFAEDREKTLLKST